MLLRVSFVVPYSARLETTKTAFDTSYRLVSQTIMYISLPCVLPMMLHELGHLCLKTANILPHILLINKKK